MELDVLLHLNKGFKTMRVTEVLDRPRSQSEVNVYTGLPIFDGPMFFF